MRSRAIVGLAALAVAGTLGACGSSDRTTQSHNSPLTQKLLADAIGAARSLHSYRLDATIMTGGHVAKETLEVDGPTASLGILHFPAGVITFINLGAFTYFNAPTSFWSSIGRLTPAQVSDYGGHWLRLPTASSPTLQQAVNMISTPAAWAKCWAESKAMLRYGGTATVDGHRAVILINSGTAPGTAPGKVYLSMTSPKLPLRSVITGPPQPGGPAACGDKGRISSGIATFSGFNRHFRITAPRHSLAIATAVFA